MAFDGYSFPHYRELTRTEELFYMKRWLEHRCYRSREIVINANQKFVAKVARRFRKEFCHVTIPDLIGYANFGFLHAMDIFDPTRGTNIRTASVQWIRQAIQNNAHTNESAIRIPANIHEQIRKKAKQKNVDFSDDEKAIIDNYRGLHRTEDKIGDDDSSMTLGDLYAHKNHDISTQPDSIAHNNMTCKYLSELIDALPTDEREVIKRIYGIDCEQFTLREIGDVMNRSHEGARKLRNQAHRRMRWHIKLSQKIDISDI